MHPLLIEMWYTSYIMPILYPQLYHNLAQIVKEVVLDS